VLEGLRGKIVRLAREKDVAEVARIAAHRGDRTWIVGGALRDLALGRDVPEVDVAVDGDAAAIAREMESRGHGRAVLLSGDRAPRVFRIAGRTRTVDLAEIEGGTIEADLARRDFGANALAVELPGGELLDPYGGLVDLSRRRLRMVSEKNLADDPLRPLRAARLFATHGLAPDRETSRASRRVASGLARVARERVQVELAKLLESPRAAAALAWAADNGLLAPALGIPLPEPRWRRISRAAAALDSPSARKLPGNRRRRLRLAFLAGKAGLSGGEAASWLRAGRWGTAEAGEVGRLLDFSSEASRSPGGDNDWRWVLHAGDHAADALRLLELLEPRRASPIRRLRARVARQRPIPEVRGADVLEWTGVRPGPEVGRLLEDVRIEALAGRVRTRREARRWLQKRASPRQRLLSL
jgi:tRNA nucleotidyltransferase/poly(A) polymerase